MRVVHALTSMRSPLAPVIQRDLRDALGSIDDVESVEAEFVFGPSWSADRMSDHAKFLLGVYGR